jgi:hypothetical protein
MGQTKTYALGSVMTLSPKTNGAVTMAINMVNRTELAHKQSQCTTKFAMQKMIGRAKISHRKLAYKKK